MDKIYIIISIIIVIIVTLVTIYYFELDFIVNKSMDKSAYRLGDMYYCITSRFGRGGKYYHYKKFPNSIATKYMKQTEKSLIKTNNLNALSLIINNDEYKNFVKPNKNSIVIHLRVGDVIDNTNNSVEDFLNKDIRFFHSDILTTKYVHNRQYYQKIISQLPNNINNVIFVYGYHKDGDHIKSEQYVHAISEIFKLHGFNVNYRRDMDPDEDFIYMCNSNHFVKSGGGFSNLISEMVKKNGNIVYN